MLLLKITTGQRASRLLAHEGFQGFSEEREKKWHQVAEPEGRQQDLDFQSSEMHCKSELLEQILYDW